MKRFLCLIVLCWFTSAKVNMAIIVNLDVMMAKRKMSLNTLSELACITLSNLSILKQGKVKAIRFSTLEIFILKIFSIFLNLFSDLYDQISIMIPFFNLLLSVLPSWLSV